MYLTLIGGVYLFGSSIQARDEPHTTGYGIVSRFIDGDTVEVRFEQGDVQVRLHAIDTPDMEQLYYAAADAALVLQRARSEGGGLGAKLE